MKLEAKNLSFSFGDHPVLRNLSFSAGPGELIALLGPNGVGKSTLFRCLLGFLRPDAGSVLLNGRELRTMGRPSIARQIAYIPQSSRPVFNYTVRETVLMGVTGSLALLEIPKAAQLGTVDRTLDQLGILPLAGRGCGELSGGERQLVLLARALVQNANILIMDEPTANLDYGNQSRVMERMRTLACGGYTVIFSTHDPNQALLNATRAIAMGDGMILADGTPAEILSERLLEQLYGIRILRRTIQETDRTVPVCVPKPGRRM